MSEQPVTPSSPEITSDDRLWGLLSFLLTPIIPILILVMEDKKNRPFLKYHAVPTLILGIVEIIVIGLLNLIPIVGCISSLVWIYNLVLGLKANKGEYVEIPFITNFAKQQGWL